MACTTAQAQGLHHRVLFAVAADLHEPDGGSGAFAERGGRRGRSLRRHCSITMGDYAALLAKMGTARGVLGASNVSATALDAVKQTRKLRKAVGALTESTFFPGGKRQDQATLAELETGVFLRALAERAACAWRPDRTAVAAADYHQPPLGPRGRPWVDRLHGAHG
jgi:hypothetical protein